MTQYHPWEIYNHGQTPIPEGRVQVQLSRETRPSAEKSEPCAMYERLRRGAHVIAFRRVKEPVRGAEFIRLPKIAMSFPNFGPEFGITYPTENNQPIPDTYIGKNTGAEITVSKTKEVG